MKRAQACRDYLISNGIEGNRITAVGYGGERPTVPNDSEENRETNRRIEVVELQPPSAGVKGAKQNSVIEGRVGWPIPFSPLAGHVSEAVRKNLLQFCDRNPLCCSLPFAAERALSSVPSTTCRSTGGRSLRGVRCGHGWSTMAPMVRPSSRADATGEPKASATSISARSRGISPRIGSVLSVRCTTCDPVATFGRGSRVRP